MNTTNRKALTMPEPILYYLETLQFADGGLFDSEPTDNLVHLVRGTTRGTPGPTLCGIDRFSPESPGWSLGGGVTGRGMVHTPCPGCVETARRDFPNLPIAGMRALSNPIAAALNVRAVDHMASLPRPQAMSTR